MRTWSLARALDDARAVVKAALALVFAPALDALYPPLTHDDDRVVDGAEELAEREAETECWDGGDIDMPIIRTRPWGAGIEDVPGQEPPLDDNELVGVRGILQERYGVFITGVRADRTPNCPNGCDCSCCYGYTDRDCHCFTYPCNCGGGPKEHGDTKSSACSTTVRAVSDGAVSDSFPRVPAPSRTDDRTHQKGEGCWCGEHVSAEGSEKSVIEACKHFRSRHMHLPFGPDRFKK